MSIEDNDPLSEDEIDLIVEQARDCGLIVPRHEDALRYVWTLMHSGMCHTRFSVNQRNITLKPASIKGLSPDARALSGTTANMLTEDYLVSVCDNDCCLQMAAIPNHIGLLGNMLMAAGMVDKVDNLKKHTFTLRVTGMN